jgi:hypothetical protein
MGNYFDTCLSFQGINSFSTVANAAELNKRVIYARDEGGHIVGRKLIGLNENGCLVGFRTYNALDSKDHRLVLHRIFQRYAQELAQRAGLDLADDGTVPKLFAEEWYDDGVWPWSAELPDEPEQDPCKRHSAGAALARGPADRARIQIKLRGVAGSAPR